MIKTILITTLLLSACSSQRATLMVHLGEGRIEEITQSGDIRVEEIPAEHWGVNREATIGHKYLLRWYVSKEERLDCVKSFEVNSTNIADLHYLGFDTATVSSDYDEVKFLAVVGENSKAVQFTGWCR